MAWGQSRQPERARSRHRDLLYATLRKNEKEFTPTTLYNDYPTSPTRFHWESQSVTTADSATGRRYQEHASSDWRILLFEWSDGTLPFGIVPEDLKDSGA